MTAADRDGRGGLWIGGSSDAGTVVHVTANGSLDPGFGTNGVVAFNRFPVTNVLASGTGVLAFGFEGESYERRSLVTRLRADGTPDPAFNGGAPGSCRPRAVRTARRCSLTAASSSPSTTRSALSSPTERRTRRWARRASSRTGVPEPVIAPRGTGFLIVGVDRRYLTSGLYEEFLIARAQLSPGVDDPTFGVAGRVEIPLTVAGQPSDAVRILPTLSGYVVATRSQVVKLTLTGALDPTFHRIALPLTDATAGATGSIVIAGGDRADRYLPNGDVDRSFGDDGQIPLGLQPTARLLRAARVEVEGTRLLFIGASYARPNRSDLTIVARDGAVPPGVPGLRVADTSAVENVDSLQVVASVDQAVGYPVRFRYEVTPISASMPGDTFASPILDGGAVYNEAEIPAGSRSTTLTFPVIDDRLAEGNEQLRFRVTTADGAAIIDGDATLTIVDDEPAGRTATAPSIQSRPPGNRGQIMATWTAPASVGAAQPDGYALLVYDGQQLVASAGFWPDERAGAVNGLTPSRAYDVVVLAMNAAGWGTPSARLRMTAGGNDLPASGPGALGMIGRPEPARWRRGRPDTAGPVCERRAGDPRIR